MDADANEDVDHEDDAATDVDDVVDVGDAVDGDSRIIRVTRNIGDIFTNITRIITTHIKSSIIISLSILMRSKINLALVINRHVVTNK